MFKQIAIVEKSKIIRGGLTILLQEHEIGERIVGMADFDEWTSSLKNTAPDLIILSPEMARDGIEKIRSKYGLSTSALFVGIVYQYYVQKEVSDIFDEVIYITDNEESIFNKLRNLFKQGVSDPSPSERLTDREKAVLVSLLHGKSNKEVADQLSISPHTVVTHRKNIIEKTGIRSLSGLAVYAILNNIADMDDLRQ